ncbi:MULTISPECIES: hypothetical protein [unclassified Chryseobacterium]|uniref:hypothetical protein n=1 Tax=unclassified Chryseobacterium TaxID=2593645 RepID=UPI001158B2F9|nr:hypothetical protein [Chryseobacterium sp. ON_d1]GEJ46083.1 hypothetical protein CRS_26910 [Chryseobacterium sp. ON_d1]
MIKSISILFVLVPYLLFSQSISGSYFSAGSKCKISLKIDAMNHFVFSSKKDKKIQGTVKVVKENEVTYLDFRDDIGGVFSNDTISIQNSGNSGNLYLHFKACDEKYIHLFKKDFREIKKR